MHSLDFISQSPPIFIFQKEANKTNLGGVLFLIYILLCLAIFLYYILNYLKNNKYEIQYNLIYNNTFVEDVSAMLNNTTLNPKIKTRIALFDEKHEFLSDNFVLYLRVFKKIAENRIILLDRVSNLEVEVLYKCKDHNNCDLREEDERISYYFYFGYSHYFISHQNSSSPVYKDEDMDEAKDYEFSFYRPVKKNVDWQIFKYKEEGGLFSEGKEYIGGTIKSGDIFVYDIPFARNVTNETTTIPYRHLFTFKVNNDFDYYDQYIRTEVSWLTIFANSFSLWMSLYSGFKMVFDFIYAKNFNNYKIIQNILSKVEKTKIKERDKIELSSDLNMSDKLIDNNQSNEKNIIIKEDLIEKEKLTENSEEYRGDISEDDSIELPKLHFFDYLFNNLYCSQKCFCDYKKQMMITTSNKILYKYFSIENILYNQIKMENLLKDYRWNNPRLKSIQNNDLISELKCYLQNT